jgi:hypothetical protein
MISYSTLNNNYSTAAPKGFREFTKAHGIATPNTCAVRLAYALFLCDRELFSDVKAKSGVEWYGLPTKAADLAIVLNNKVHTAQLISSKSSLVAQKEKGIIFFDTIVGFGGTGHISLWDGDEVGDGIEFFDSSPRVYFWRLD